MNEDDVDPEMLKEVEKLHLELLASNPEYRAALAADGYDAGEIEKHRKLITN
jgi:hypothetical protein